MARKTHLFLSAFFNGRPYFSAACLPTENHPFRFSASSGAFLLRLTCSAARAAVAGIFLLGPSLSAAHAEGPAYRTHLAGVGPEDPRQRVDTTQMPWSAIGRVQTELGSRCTGFLISPVLVETAAHCLWLSPTARFIRPTSVHFLRAYSGDHYIAHARVVRVMIPPGYTTAEEARTAGLDHATLVLDHPVAKPDDVFHVTAGPADIAPGTPIMLGGYEQNQPDIITADLACHITGLSQDLDGHTLFTHDCAGTHGSSGAPVLTQTQGGWQVLGVQVQASTQQAGGRAVPLLNSPSAQQ
ncbi:trypsin-like serine peptidase [Acetobacter senegalensis]|uniref:trypsin-like serine peptidase n=1 Tax=Acetobacter senegalensis TaxID=446692 RepID=UPI002651192C|nr:trypsin-like peptidase domain-containing protein [Acetobacter senegalensis]MDN7350430.1 trypsin-like peptidase domain-containing protein [Acetobacter senegalensis]